MIGLGLGGCQATLSRRRGRRASCALCSNSALSAMHHAIGVPLKCAREIGTIHEVWEVRQKARKKNNSLSIWFVLAFGDGIRGMDAVTSEKPLHIQRDAEDQRAQGEVPIVDIPIRRKPTNSGVQGPTEYHIAGSPKIVLVREQVQEFPFGYHPRHMEAFRKRRSGIRWTALTTNQRTRFVDEQKMSEYKVRFGKSREGGDGFKAPMDEYIVGIQHRYPLAAGRIDQLIQAVMSTAIAPALRREVAHPTVGTGCQLGRDGGGPVPRTVIEQ